MQIKVYSEEKLKIRYDEATLLESIDFYNVPGDYYKLKGTDNGGKSKTVLILNTFMPTIAFKPFHDYFSQAKKDIVSGIQVRLPLTNFCNYLLLAKDTKSKKGSYAEIMPYYIAAFGIKHELCKFPKLNEDKYKHIRFESKVLYTCQRELLLKFPQECKKYIKLGYQKEVITGDGRTQDAVTLVKVCIEVQENNVNHIDNPNDDLKECLVLSQGYHPLFFNEADFENDKCGYFQDFYNNRLTPAIKFGFLRFGGSKNSDEEFRISKSVKQEILIAEFEKHINATTHATGQIANEEPDSLKSARYENVHDFFKDFYNSSDSAIILKKLFEWKELECKTGTLVIPLREFVQEILREKYSHDVVTNIMTLIESTLPKHKEYEQTLGDVMMSWKGVVFLMFHLAGQGIIKNEVILKISYYLLSVQDIYDNIIMKNVVTEYNNVIDNMCSYNDVMQDHLEKKVKSKYFQYLNTKTDKITSITNENAALKVELDRSERKHAQLTATLDERVRNIEAMVGVSDTESIAHELARLRKHCAVVKEASDDSPEETNDARPVVDLAEGKFLWTGSRCNLLFTKDVCDRVEIAQYKQCLKDGRLSNTDVKFLHDELCVSKQCVRNIKYLTDAQVDALVNHNDDASSECGSVANSSMDDLEDDDVTLLDTFNFDFDENAPGIDDSSDGDSGEDSDEGSCVDSNADSDYTVGSNSDSEDDSDAGSENSSDGGCGKEV